MSVPFTQSTIAPPRAGIADTPVTRAIGRAAAATGVDFSYLLGQARIESGLNPAARARTSSATGLFQFIDQTWLATLKRHGSDHGMGWAANAISRAPSGRWQVADPAMRAAVMGLRKDANAASLMAGEFAADNRAHLERRLGREAQPVDLYLAHFLGPAGAGKFLERHAASPDAPAATAFPAAATANRNIFYARDGRARSFDEIRDRFAAKLGGAAAAPFQRDTGSAAASAVPPGQRTVAPADWLRLVGSTDSAASLPVRSNVSANRHADGPIVAGRMIDPARARLAYMLLAGTTGGGL